MELVDCHTHTIYSDGGSTLDENIAAAEARGLTTIACTDHFAHPAFMDCAVDESRIAELAPHRTSTPFPPRTSISCSGGKRIGTKDANETFLCSRRGQRFFWARCII